MSQGDDAPADVPADVPAPGAKGRPSLKQRLEALFENYGRIAIVTYFSLSILAIIGFSVAIWLGVEPSGATGVLGVIGAGWLAAKATLPIRILITLGLTPAIGYIVGRRRRAAAAADEPVAPDAEAP
jgi:hypothetical protein